MSWMSILAKKNEKNMKNTKKQPAENQNSTKI